MKKRSKKVKLLILSIIIYLILPDVAYPQGSNGVVAVDSSHTRETMKISRIWQLPEILKEISGIAYIDDEKVACVQDEIGTIFIYNISSRAIESEIPFGPPGDYEAITIVDEDAYIAVADGRIIEVGNYRSEKPVIKEYGTHLTVRQNVEGLCYDRKNKRLLVAIKGTEEGSPSYKGIYSFDLTTKAMPVSPVIKIDLQDPVFQRLPFKRKPQTLIQPSEIDIDPATGDIYICDGVRSQILVMDDAGNIKALHALIKSEFTQPEGIMFTPSGELFIANEGHKHLPAKLIRLDLK